MLKIDLQPELMGNLLRLRPLLSEDFEALYLVSSDPLVWEMHPEKDRYQRAVFQKFFQAAIESKGALIAFDAVTGEVIGSSRFTGLDLSRSQVEVGYTFLARKYWGRGFNKEMKRLMLTHAFNFVDKVLFYIGENNLRSRRAIEKIGAQLIERIERQPKEEARYSKVIYALEKRQFEAVDFKVET